MKHDITEPLTLWRGSHKPGSGKGCSMNVVSWANGDATITDYPACSDPMLSRIVQGVNDSLAQDDGSLTPEDSMRVLDLGFATVGTAYHGLSDLELKVIYIRCAVLAARKVLHLNDDPRVVTAIEATEAWCSDPATATASAATASAAAAAARASAASAAYAARAAASAAYAASAVDAAYAASAAASAAGAAGRAAGSRYFRAELAAEIIDLFKSLTGTGLTATVVPVTEAIKMMQEVSV